MGALSTSTSTRHPHRAVEATVRACVWRLVGETTSPLPTKFHLEILPVMISSRAPGTDQSDSFNRGFM